MTSATTTSPADGAGPATGDSHFPGWEVFVPQFVHPVKVAVVEALRYFGEPLSATLFAKLFSGQGEGFHEANVRYHVWDLVEIGVLEVVPPGPVGDEHRKGRFVYFAAVSTRRKDSEQHPLMG